MKITVSRSLLADTLRKVQGLAPGKAASPILSNVKIEATGDTIKFTTTDLDVSIVAEIKSNVIEDGAITLPAKILSEAVARSSEGDISMDVNEAESRAVVKSGSSVFRITGLPADMFPPLPAEGDDNTEFVIPQEKLKEMFRRTSYSMSQDDTRAILKGIHMAFENGKLTCVATDGRRLAIAEYEPETPYQFSLSFTLPAKTVAEINKNLGSTGNVTLKQCKSQITATLENGIVLYSKLMVDQYPNYKAVIPKSNENIVEIDRNLLVAAIKRVGVFAEEHSMKFVVDAGAINLRSSTEAGDGEEIVPVKYDGVPINSNFNHAYLLDALNAIDDDMVKFAFSDGLSPLIITGSYQGLSLIMPLRVS